MDFSHPCKKIVNVLRRVHMSKSTFSYQDNSYNIVINKVKTHNSLFILYENAVETPTPNIIEYIGK